MAFATATGVYRCDGCDAEIRATDCGIHLSGTRIEGNAKVRTSVFLAIPPYCMEHDFAMEMRLVREEESGAD